MAGGYADLLRRAYEAWNEGDRQFILDHMHPDFVWVAPPDDPDRGTYEGHQGVEHFWDNWREAFGHLRIEVEELIESGDVVLGVVRRGGTGEASGINLQERVYQVFTFRDGKGERCEEFYDRNRAFAAAGLEPPGERTAER